MAHRCPTRLTACRALPKGLAAMYVEYLVLQAEAEQGALARVRAEKLNRSWETLQAALDELGQQEWDLYTTIYSPTKERGGPGEHYCEGFILKRVSYTASERAPEPGSMPELEPLPKPSDF
jgi:hypothetical protein